MIRPALASFACLASLPGCSVIFPEDERIGEEPLAMCEERLGRILPTNVTFQLGQVEGVWTPTYTYDVTKLSLDEIKALSVVGDDETLGTRMTLSTNENATARDQFMRTPVSKAGAFFLTGDPALYRVRGEPVDIANIITAGCEAQLANMRLIALSWERPIASEPAQSADNENENNS